MPIYKNDAQVSGRPFSDYGARLLKSWSVSGGAPAHVIQKARGSTRFNVYGSDPSLLTVALPIVYIDVIGPGSPEEERAREVSRNKQALESLFKSGVVSLGLPDGYFYDAVLIDIGAEKYHSGTFREVTYTFSGSKYGREFYHSFYAGDGGSPGTQRIYIDGALPADVCYTIFPAGSECAIAGIRVTGVTANDEVKIDGIKKTVTVNGYPRFEVCDLIEWPKMTPGSNVVEYSGIVRGYVEGRETY